MSQHFRVVKDIKEADALYEAGLLWVAADGPGKAPQYVLDRPGNIPPSVYVREDEFLMPAEQLPSGWWKFTRAGRGNDTYHTYNLFAILLEE